MITLELVANERPAQIRNVIHKVLYVDHEVPCAVFSGKTPRSDQFKQEKEERDRLLEAMTSYKMEKTRLKTRCWGRK